MKGARVRNLMVEYRSYETVVACYRCPEYQAQKIRRRSPKRLSWLRGPPPDVPATGHIEHVALHQSGGVLFGLYLCHLGRNAYSASARDAVHQSAPSDGGEFFKRGLRVRCLVKPFVSLLARWQTHCLCNQAGVVHDLYAVNFSCGHRLR